MTLSAFIAEHRPPIAAVLKSATAFSALYPATPWSRDVERRYRAMEGGKMLRGILTVLGYGISGSRKTADAYELAATVELLHAVLIIHDDVIDRDLLRRGKPSVFAQYAALGGKPDRDHVGASLAVCAGDVGLMHASRRLVQMGAQYIHAAHAADSVLEAIARTGFGEMEDVALSAGIEHVTEAAIVRMLTDKTARYSCAMPLVAGATLGGAPAMVTDALDRIGEDLGLIFQVRDDELGLFGSAQETGKPAGSDVREGKQTLHALYLTKAASPRERKELATIYGNAKMTAKQLARVRSLTDTYGVREKIARLIARREQRVRTTIDTLDTTPVYRSLLGEVLTFVSARKS